MFHPAGCTVGCVYSLQCIVQPVVQLIVQRVVKCRQTFTVPWPLTALNWQSATVGVAVGSVLSGQHCLWHVRHTTWKTMLSNCAVVSWITRVFSDYLYQLVLLTAAASWKQLRVHCDCLVRMQGLLFTQCGCCHLSYVNNPFINKSKRNGYCSPDLPDFNNLCTSMKVDLFNKVLKIPTHALHPLLPPPVSHTQRYGLW